MIQKKKNFQLCLYYFSFISLMPKVNVKHKQVNESYFFSPPHHSPLFLCMSRMIQQLNSWSLLFSSLCALTWIALQKNHKKKLRGKIPSWMNSRFYEIRFMVGRCTMSIRFFWKEMNEDFCSVVFSTFFFLFWLLWENFCGFIEFSILNSYYISLIASVST